MTTPSEVRAGLTVVTDAAREDVRSVAARAPQTPSGVRAALFAAVPLVVQEYAFGAAALALDWYEELREAARPSRAFRSRPLVLVTDEDVAASVAVSTESLRDIEQEIQRDSEEILAESVKMLEDETERLVAEAHRDTMTGNAADDPDAVGWQRFARPEACKFCLMLAARGAVYTKESVRFAAHGAVMRGERKGGNCMCVAGPAFDPDAPRASVMQYVASQQERTDAERAALRKYLNENFPDAPG